MVADAYACDGLFFSVNPRAVRSIPGLLAKNARHITIIDSDAADGTGVGYVAVIPVAAQVIGGITISYSDRGYDRKNAVWPGQRVERGRPMGYFYPGSSTVVVLAQKDRVEICPDLLQQQARTDVAVTYPENAFGFPLCEISLDVRDVIAYRAGTMPRDEIPIARGMKIERHIKLWKLVPDSLRQSCAATVG
jgi:phosphatidylserine decarboxylase